MVNTERFVWVLQMVIIREDWRISNLNNRGVFYYRKSMMGFRGKSTQNKSYSELFDEVCDKNSFHRRDVEMMFTVGNRPRDDLLRLNLEELIAFDNPTEAYKRLILALRKWNQQLGKIDRKTTHSEMSVYQFVFSSLKTMAFESKDIRDQNIQNLEKWFNKTTTIRKKKLQEIVKSKPVEPQEIPVISAEASTRIKEYSRRLLEAHTGILRRKKRCDEEEDQSEEARIKNVSNRILINNLKEYRENHQNQQFRRKIEELYKHKQKLFQSLVHKKDYVQPDNKNLLRQVWHNNESSSLQTVPTNFSNVLTGGLPLHGSLIQTPVIIIQDNFSVDQPKEMTQKFKQNLDGFKPKFIALQPRSPEASRQRQTITRVRTADPYRVGKENDASRALLKKKSYNYRFQEIEAIKNKFHSSKTVSHQKLFQALNEPSIIGKVDCKLLESGFSLLINPFIDSKKGKKPRTIKSSKKI